MALSTSQIGVKDIRARSLIVGVVTALIVSACSIVVEAPQSASPSADPSAPGPVPTAPTSAPTSPLTPSAPVATPRPSTVAEALSCVLGPDDMVPDIVDAPTMAAAVEKVRLDRQEVSGGTVTMEFFREEDIGESWLMFIDGEGVASFRVWNNESGGASIILERYCQQG
jgi:hypothetical protein